MGIEFSTPWWLLLTLPAAGLLIWWWRHDSRWDRGKKLTLTVLRASIFILLIFTLAGMQLLLPAQGQVVVFVADQSASLRQTDDVWDMIRQAVAGKSPDDRFAVVTVAEEAVVDQSLSAKSEASPLSSVVTENQTDLAAGLRLAGGMIPEGTNGRIVLISDGEETRGNAVAEAERLQQRGIQVDTVHVTSQTGPEALISDIHVPARLFPGEQYQVDVEVDSTVETEATLRLYDGNHEVATRQINLQNGHNTFTFAVEASETGFHRYRAELDAAQDTMTANNQAFSYSEVMGDPAVLVVEGTEHAAHNVITALEATGTTVDRVSPDALPEQLESYKQYHSIVLANVPAFQFAEEKMELIRAAVRDFGVGLVMTGGEESFGMGGWFRTPIEEALPVYMDLRDKEKIPSLGLMLVIDKSGSMDGNGGTSKMALAKEAAIRATQMLSQKDQIGVVAFDGTPWWVVEPTYVDDVQAIQDDIGSIRADGGTDILPALQTAYEKLSALDTKRKHIILLTDGQSGGSAQYETLTESMAAEDITLSTVAVGRDADTVLLENLATNADGRYYFVTDDTTIPTIFSKETALATRSYMVEEPFQPTWTGGVDWADGIADLPPLGGYIATTAKERAELVITSPEPDPVAARWSYGLGRTVAWTSDFSGNWSSAWVQWASFSEFINRMINWTFPQYEQGEWLVEVSQHGGQGHVTLTLNDAASMPQGELQVTVVREDLSTETLPLKAVTPGTYEAVFAADEPGSYMLQVSEVNGEATIHSQTYGMAVPYSPEYRLPQNGIEKMQAIADTGQGKMIDDPKQAFTESSERGWERQPVGTWLLLLAMLLLPLDIAARRLTISADTLTRLRMTFSWRDRLSRNSTYAQTLDRLNVRKSATERRGRVIDPSPAQSPTTTKQEHIPEKNEEAVRMERAERSETSPTTDRMSRLLAAKKRGRR